MASVDDPERQEIEEEEARYGGCNNCQGETCPTCNGQ